MVRGDERPSWQTRESMSGWKNELKDQVASDRNQEGCHGENRLEDLHDGRHVEYPRTGFRKRAVLDHSTTGIEQNCE